MFESTEKIPYAPREDSGGHIKLDLNLSPLKLRELSDSEDFDIVWQVAGHLRTPKPTIAKLMNNRYESIRTNAVQNLSAPVGALRKRRDDKNEVERVRELAARTLRHIGTENSKR